MVNRCMRFRLFQRARLLPHASLLLATTLLGACSSGQAEVQRNSIPAAGPASRDEGRPAKPAEETEKKADAAKPSAPARGFDVPLDCANLRCFAFENDQAALVQLVERDRPRVIGFGEAHAPKGFSGRSTVARFRTDLLPGLAPRTQALYVELLAPAQGCTKAREATRREATAVTSGQAENNQAEYLSLGQAARAMGILPDVLRAGCADLEAIADAGELGVVTMMETIARLTANAVQDRLSTRGSTGGGDGRQLVLAYGGALHNDLVPRVGREHWSYGPTLDAATQGAYVEVDLVVPELIRSTDSWRQLAWYEAVQSTSGRGHQTWLIEVGPRSYALVFSAGTARANPSSASPAAASPAGARSAPTSGQPAGEKTTSAQSSR